MPDKNKNYYQILGLEWNASFEDIRKAYRTYAAKFHPDKHEGDAFFEERFKEVKEAYEILSDAGNRYKYDIRKFGKSRAGYVPYRSDGSGENEKPKRKLRVDLSHIDIYLTVIYFINLAGFVIIKRVDDNASPGGHAWSVFLSGVSSLLIWLFVGGLADLFNRKYDGPWMFLVGYLLLGLALGYVPLGTRWIP
jgi:curved DNA-binding protein CbpA